jgi:hypothetical protein
MSDTSQGEGWWQASDGKWYAPEQHPDYQPPAQPTEPTQPAARAGEGPPTEATPPPTEGAPPVPPVPPTQAMPMPPPGAPPGAPPRQPYPPPGAPGGPPPGAPGPDAAGRSNAKWFIGGAIALVIIAIAAFLLLRDNGNGNNVSASTDTNQTSDTSDTNSSTSSKSSKSTSSASKNTVDPNTVESNLLTAADFPAGFTNAQFTPNNNKTDPCGNPSAESKFPPTKDVGSAVQNATDNEFFQQEVEFYKDAATTKKSFDFSVNSIKQCTQGTIVNSDSTSSFAVTSVKDVSSQVGFTATEVQFTVDQFSVIEVGVQLDNAIATYTFQFPTSAGQSAVPDAIGIAKEGTQRLLS